MCFKNIQSNRKKLQWFVVDTQLFQPDLCLINNALWENFFNNFNLPYNQNVSNAPTLKRGRGRGKVMASANTMLVAPAVPTHFSNITKPKEGLKISISAEGNSKDNEASTAFPPVVQHLPKLDSVASKRWELSEPTLVETGFTVEIQQETLLDDSDIDL